MHSLHLLVLQNRSKQYLAILQQKPSQNHPKPSNVKRCLPLLRSLNANSLRSVRRKCLTAATLPFWAASQMFSPRNDQARSTNRRVDNKPGPLSHGVLTPNMVRKQYQNRYIPAVLNWWFITTSKG